MRICLRRASSHLRCPAFTLIEAMVGMAVLGLVFVALYSGMVYGFKLIGMARENLRATQILQERFEGIRLYNWDQLNDATFVTPTFQVPFYPNQSNSFY